MTRWTRLEEESRKTLTWLSAHWTTKLTTQLAITAIATVGIVLHKTARVTFDLSTVSLVALGLLPWLGAVIKSLELPGGFKIDLQQTKAKAEKAIRTAEEAQSVAESVQTRARISETITRTASGTGTDAQPARMLTKEQAQPLASALVEQYLKIRKDNKPGPSRTQLMESKIIEMFTVAKQWPDFEWQKHLEDPDKGWRLFSYAYVTAHPTFNKLDAVAESAWKFRDRGESTDNNRPFGEYWSIRAMQALANIRGSEAVSASTRSLLLNHYRQLRSGTDRHYEMRQLLGMLEIPIPT